MIKVKKLIIKEGKADFSSYVGKHLMAVIKTWRNKPSLLKIGQVDYSSGALWLKGFSLQPLEDGMETQIKLEKKLVSITHII